MIPQSRNVEFPVRSPSGWGGTGASPRCWLVKIGPQLFGLASALRVIQSFDGDPNAAKRASLGALVGIAEDLRPFHSDEPTSHHLLQFR